MKKFLEIRHFIARHLRHKFSRPLTVAREGQYIMPWVTSKDLSTDYLFNGMRERALRGRNVQLRLVQFGSDGTIKNRKTIDLGYNEIVRWRVANSTKTEQMEYGYSLIEQGSPNDGINILQHHFRLFSDTSEAMTHGRPRGLYRYPKSDWLDEVIKALDPFPFVKQASLLPVCTASQGFLLLNVCNRQSRIEVSAGEAKIQSMEIAPFGTRLFKAADLQRTQSQIQFRASAPFTFYVVISREDGSAPSIQHVRDSF